MALLKQPARRNAATRLLRMRLYGILFLLLAGIALGCLVRSNYGQARISTVSDPAAEIVALNQAIEAYHESWGEYPPNFNDEAVVRQHLLKRFPNLADDELIPPVVDAGEALVFWLGGFSSNGAYPITGRGGPLSPDSPRRQGLYAFDPARLVPTSYGKEVYLPTGLGRTEPYVYFRTAGRRKLVYPARDPRLEAYRQSATEYVNRSSFQILCAGEDDRWGELPAPYFPAGPFTGGHADNRANFSPGLLGDKKLGDVGQ